MPNILRLSVCLSFKFLHLWERRQDNCRENRAKETALSRFLFILRLSVPRQPFKARNYSSVLQMYTFP